ncbi:hypothetical protein AURDEDRAFT_115857 [Auricularia subglabra TFB-10046 SS5]|nr:hypothetical protein AURDEDRAFT_115857 [Auricularia subglabra TFB-10046 SS5]
MSDSKPPTTTPPDPGSKLVLGPAELEFMKRQTGIQDEHALRAHIIAVQQKAYRAFPWPYIDQFAFLWTKITAFGAYAHVLQLGRERPGALFLDVGCCFGTDARKLAEDGFPAAQILCIDSEAEFWRLGEELYTARSPGIRFLHADVFSFNFSADTPGASALYASALFHLFSEAQQRALARRLAALLKRERGSVAFGWHIGARSKGTIQIGDGPGTVFCHSPESWRALWEEEGAVEVKAVLRDPPAGHALGPDAFFLEWEVWVL